MIAHRKVQSLPPVKIGLDAELAAGLVPAVVDVAETEGAVPVVTDTNSKKNAVDGSRKHRRRAAGCLRNSRRRNVRASAPRESEVIDWRAYAQKTYGGSTGPGPRVSDAVVVLLVILGNGEKED